MEQLTLLSIRCSRCKEQLPDDLFTPSAQRRRAGYCKPCAGAYMRQHKNGRCVVCSAAIRSSHMRCAACATAGRRRTRTPSSSVRQLITHGAKPSGRRWREVQEQVWAEETVCRFCNQPVDQTLHHNHPMARNVDHVVPIAHGGAMYERSNLRLSHRRCNSLAGAGAFTPELAQIMRLAVVLASYRL